MTEAEWLTSANVHKLKKFLPHPLSRCKCILTVCGYSYHTRKHIPAPEIVDLLSRCETGADDDPPIAVPFQQLITVYDEPRERLPLNSPDRAICSSLVFCLHTASAENPFIGTVTLHSWRMAVARFTHPTPPDGTPFILPSSPEQAATPDQPGPDRTAG
jgi:hypothetical protein